MTDLQWATLQKVIRGDTVDPAPVGFVVDSPWLPNWYGVTIRDYFSNDARWLKANLKALRDFPDVMFLPGFWSEFGMCTEPSAFGARCTFPADEFPFAHRTISSTDEIDAVSAPDPRTDGLLPFMLNRLLLARPEIEAAGHKIRFAVSRGPLNIASYLMGSTEFMTTMMMQPEKAHDLLKTITSFIKDWLRVQREAFPSIDGIFLLDDIIGFLGEEEFRTFCLPYFKELFDKEVSVRFLHNDAPCRVCAPYLPEMGVNLFNMGFDISLGELKQLTQNKVALLGNIPPRDVLASHDKTKITEAAQSLAASLPDRTMVIFSCGGGMPPGVSSEDIKAFIDAIKNFKRK
jgi:uroporphyrinogen-III decarboxylase